MQRPAAPAHTKLGPKTSPKQSKIEQNFGFYGCKPPISDLSDLSDTILPAFF